MEGGKVKGNGELGAGIREWKTGIRGERFSSSSILSPCVQ